MKAIRYFIILVTILFAGIASTHAQTDISSTTLGEALLTSKGRTITTRRLIESHARIHSVPIEVKIQKISPGLYTLSIPIEMSSAVEEYPQGRQLGFQDNMGNIIIQTINGVSVTPTVSTTDESESSQFFSDRIYSNNTADTNSAFESGNGYFCHPRFILTQEQLEVLQKKGNAVQRIVVAKADGNGFWFYYPTNKFQKEIAKLILKFKKIS